VFNRQVFFDFLGFLLGLSELWLVSCFPLFEGVAELHDLFA
jgi:hypothetical protein